MIYQEPSKVFKIINFYRTNHTFWTDPVCNDSIPANAGVQTQSGSTFRFNAHDWNEPLGVVECFSAGDQTRNSHVLQSRK